MYGIGHAGCAECGVHLLALGPTAHVVGCRVEVGQLHARVVVFTAIPVTACGGRFVCAPLTVGIHTLGGAVGVGHIEHGTERCRSRVACQFVLHEAVAHDTHVGNASRHLCQQGVSSRCQQRCHVIGAVEHMLVIGTLAGLQHILCHLAPVQSHGKHAYGRCVESCRCHLLVRCEVEVAPHVGHVVVAVIHRSLGIHGAIHHVVRCARRCPRLDGVAAGKVGRLVRCPHSRSVLSRV